MPSSYTTKWALPLIAEDDDFKIVDDYDALSNRVEEIIPDAYVVSVEETSTDSEGNTTGITAVVKNGDDETQVDFKFAEQATSVDLSEIEERLKKIEDFFENSGISLDDNTLSLETTYDPIDSLGYLTVKR